MDVLFGIILTRIILENLLSVIVTHSNDLLMSPDTPAQIWHLQCQNVTCKKVFFTLADTTAIPIFGIYLHARLFCTLTRMSSIPLGAMSERETYF